MQDIHIRGVRVEIKSKDGEGNIRALGILLKEVLQQIPIEGADRLINAYKSGKAIQLTIFESAGGPTKKCAFSYGLVEDPRLDKANSAGAN